MNLFRQIFKVPRLVSSWKKVRFDISVLQSNSGIKNHVYGGEQAEVQMWNSIKDIKMHQYNLEPEIRSTEIAILKIETFEKLFDQITEFTRLMAAGKENQIGALLEFYMICFMESYAKIEEKSIQSNSLSESEKKFCSDSVNAIGDLLLAHLVNMSISGLLAVLRLSVQSQNNLSLIREKRKFFRVFEFCVARTQLTVKMNETEITSLLRSIEIYFESGGVSKDIAVELLEKIELSIITANLRDFDANQLTSLLQIYKVHSLGTQDFFNLLRGNFLAIIKQMSLNQQVLAYSAFVESGHFESKTVLPTPHVQWLVNKSNSLNPYYRIIFEHAHAKQRHLHVNTINKYLSLFRSSSI